MSTPASASVTSRRTLPPALGGALFFTLFTGGLLNAPIFMRRHQDNIGIESTLVGAEIALALAVTGLLALLASLGSRRIFRAFALPALGFSVIASYFMTVDHVVIGHGIIEAIFTTEMDLTLELISPALLVWVVIGLGVSLPAFWWLTRDHVSILSRARWRRPLWVEGAFLAAAVVIAKLAMEMLDGHDQKVPERQTDYRPSTASLAAHRYVPSNWLTGLAMSGSGYVERLTRAKQLRDPARDFAWQAPEALNDAVVVLVIGESARADNLGLLGYTRQTTPKLGAEPNLVALKGEACDTSTALSLRCMFVRHEGFRMIDAHRGLPVEDNLFSVFDALGFSIELFGMQAEVGFYRQTRADHFKIREVVVAESYNRGRAADDLMLVTELAASIDEWKRARTGRPHLVILHTKGSHYQYSKRYPRAFSRWQPECREAASRCTQAELLNAYDNSLHYTDHVLHSALEVLRDEKAFLFYVSDHGESIEDNLHYHGTPKAVAPKEQLSVPFMLWFSDTWLSEPANRSRLDRLRSQAGRLGRHVEIFDSLLGCAGIASPDGGLHPERNWCH